MVKQSLCSVLLLVATAPHLTYTQNPAPKASTLALTCTIPTTALADLYLIAKTRGTLGRALVPGVTLITASIMATIIAYQKSMHVKQQSV